ncbi:hypothetical protein BDZ45DRAFT_693349 [Acephala macrosclerotiorum]|nr:hypothetical protein BDZ45DRAFT_693349 [Acephala macrosclerotiorum]
MALPDGQPIVIKEEWHIVDHMKCIAKEAAAWYKIPALLHTNQEARHAAQRVYKMCFEANLHGNNGVWMDIDRDILTIHDDICYASMAFFGNSSSTHPVRGQYIEPLVTIKEKLPMIAFQEFPSQYQVSPTILDKMGKPEKIYMVRYSGAPLGHQLVLKGVDLPSAWQNGVGRGYLEPEVEILTYKTLRAKLKVRTRWSHNQAEGGGGRGIREFLGETVHM